MAWRRHESRSFLSQKPSTENDQFRVVVLRSAWNGGGEQSVFMPGEDQSFEEAVVNALGTKCTIPTRDHVPNGSESSDTAPSRGALYIHFDSLTAELLETCQLHVILCSHADL